MTVVKTTIKCIAKVAIRSMYYLGWDVQYPYTADLMLLNFCSPPHGYAIPELEQVSTPLHSDSWEASLAAHPDRAYVQYIMSGPPRRLPGGFSPHSDQQLSLSISVVSLLKAACWAPSRLPGRDICTSTGSV